MRDPLRYTFDDARRQLLLDGIAMSTADKVAWFEEMVALVVAVGVVDWLAAKRGTGPGPDAGRDAGRKDDAPADAGR